MISKQTILDHYSESHRRIRIEKVPGNNERWRRVTRDDHGVSGSYEKMYALIVSSQVKRTLQQVLPDQDARTIGKLRVAVLGRINAGMDPVASIHQVIAIYFPE